MLGLKGTPNKQYVTFSCLAACLLILLGVLGMLTRIFIKTVDEVFVVAHMYVMHTNYHTLYIMISFEVLVIIG